MGGNKRKLERKKEKMERKIRRLYKKLKKLDSDSDDSTSSTHLPPEELVDPGSPMPETLAVEETTSPNEETTSPNEELSPSEELSVPETTLPTEGLIVPDEETLDAELLSALGEVEQTAVGPTAHPEIANRWAPVLAKGLTKETRNGLYNAYIPYENIPIMPPKLNPEIMAAVSEPVKKRDSIIADRQKLVGAALTALGKSLQLFLQRGDKVEIIKHVNDAAKLLCDTIHSDTISRRHLIGAVINKDMKDCLTEEADTFLFGSNLVDKIRSTKAVQKSIKDLKSTNNYVPNKAPNKTTKTLNWRGPPRPSNRLATGGKPNNQSAKQRVKDYKGQQQTSRNNNNYNRRR